MPRERIKKTGPAPKTRVRVKSKAVKAVKKTAKSKRVRQAATDALLGTGAVRALARASKKPAKVRGKTGAKRVSKKK